ncbi:hypothetical protein ACFSJ3_05405 [Corallincola platygyrae]|uniref:Uncharacterized protein n=1 Tax=Corallincola platygyrae TaxID=1193278 RepID=A0ABW4XIN3_9GAMM
MFLFVALIVCDYAFASSMPNIISLTGSRPACLGFKFEEGVGNTTFLRVPVIKGVREEYPSAVIIGYHHGETLLMSSSIDIGVDAKNSARVSFDYNDDLGDVSLSVLYSFEHQGKLVPSLNIYEIDSINDLKKQERAVCP